MRRYLKCLCAISCIAFFHTLSASIAPTMVSRSAYVLRNMNLDLSDAKEVKIEAINKNGWVVGTMEKKQPDSSSFPVGFVYDTKHQKLLEILLPLTPYEKINVASINDKGEVAGSMDGHPFMWSRVKGYSLIALPEATPPLAVAGFNNKGELLLMTEESSETQNVTSSFFFYSEKGDLVPLSLPKETGVSLMSLPVALNDKSEMLFTFFQMNDENINLGFCILKEGALIRLELPPPDSHQFYLPSGMNNEGDVAGIVLTQTAEGSFSNCPVGMIWMHDGKKIVIDHSKEGYGVLLTAINDRGEVVGNQFSLSPGERFLENENKIFDKNQPFLWVSQHGFRLLQDLVTLSHDLGTFTESIALDNQGEIVARGKNREGLDFFTLLTPATLLMPTR